MAEEAILYIEGKTIAGNHGINIEVSFLLLHKKSKVQKGTKVLFKRKGREGAQRSAKGVR